MSLTHITVAGKTDDPSFQRSRCIAQALCDLYPDRIQISVMEFFECQWNQFVKSTANKLKGVFYNHSESPLVFLNETEYVGDGDAFLTWALHNFNYKDELRFSDYQRMALESFKEKINCSKTRKYAQVNFSVGGATSAVIIELFQDICP